MKLRLEGKQVIIHRDTWAKIKYCTPDELSPNEQFEYEMDSTYWKDFVKYVGIDICILTTSNYTQNRMCLM